MASKLPLQNDNANVAKAPASPRAAAGKPIGQMWQNKLRLDHILCFPHFYIGAIDKDTQKLWVYENDEMVCRSVTYVPGLYKIFDEVLVNAADNKQRDPSMDSVKVVIDVEQNLISVYSGYGVPVEIHQEEGVYVPEMIFGQLLTYDDNVKKTTGGINRYGAKLTNIFSTEFIIETADGKRRKKYKQVFENNTRNRSEPVITDCKKSENWTKVTFKPDLKMFNMTELENDVVALMKKRVYDIAGCLGKSVTVELNGKPVPIQSFSDYVDLYLSAANKSRTDPLPRMAEKVNDRWEVFVSLSDGQQFQQVSFVNSIATIKGGAHVDYVTSQVTNYIVGIVNKKNKNANVKTHNVKNHLWVFVNALIDNPAFDSQTKEILTLPAESSFGSEWELSEHILKKVAKSGVVENLLSWETFKLSKELNKSDGAKTRRVEVEKLVDANETIDEDFDDSEDMEDFDDSEDMKDFDDSEDMEDFDDSEDMEDFDDSEDMKDFDEDFDDPQRPIPSMVDGLKPVQRLILFCAFKRNLVKNANVAEFLGYVSEHSAYYQSLASTIIGMAQDYVGSNNVNLLEPNGQFGTRTSGGKDAARARYIFTKLSPATRVLFPKDDDVLLDYQIEEDGQEKEPTWYIPIIPFVLVNGAEGTGTGTGLSTFIPNYNPREIVANIRRLLNGENMVPMDPWYRGFKGGIEKTVSKEGVCTYTTTGVCKMVNKTTLRIEELPIGKWTDDYIQFLNRMKADNGESFIQSIKRNGDDDRSVDLEITLGEENMLAAEQEGFVEKFKLTTTIATSEMHLFDRNDAIKKYATPEEILEAFFHLRLEYYKKRKEIMLENLNLELLKLDDKVKYIHRVLSGESLVSKMNEAEFVHVFRQRGFRPFPKMVEAAVAGATDGAEKSEESSVAPAPSSPIDYLLAIRSLTMEREKAKELSAQRDKMINAVKDLEKATPKSLWLKDLEAFDKELDELDQQIEERQVKWEKIRALAGVGIKAALEKFEARIREKTAPKKASESVTTGDSNSAMDTDNKVAEVVKPKGRQGTKRKAPAAKEVEEDATKKTKLYGIKYQRKNTKLYGIKRRRLEKTGDVFAVKSRPQRVNRRYVWWSDSESESGNESEFDDIEDDEDDE